ncbi:MAG: anti-sigma factor [Chloroflexaceae bacterium]|jgi:anti-sigma-K factor RskA|nr:anti-sigma factor [Chloroflexaceae bacterium]
MSTPVQQPDNDIDAMLAAYALGEADEATTRQVERLLADNPAYRQQFAEYQQIATLLPLAAPKAAPASDLRNRLLERVSAEAAGKPLPAAAPARPTKPRMPWWQRLVLAANLLLVIGLGWWNVSLQQQNATLQEQQQAASTRVQRTWNNMVAAMTAPGVQQYVLASNQANVNSAFLFAPEQRLGCLVISGLPQLPAGQVYQVWLEQNGERRSVGSFRANADGNAWLIVNNATPISDFSGLIVTVEPDSLSPAPTTPPVVSGTLT